MALMVELDSLVTEYIFILVFFFLLKFSVYICNRVKTIYWLLNFSQMLVYNSKARSHYLILHNFNLKYLTPVLFCKTAFALLVIQIIRETVNRNSEVNKILQTKPLGWLSYRVSVSVVTFEVIPCTLLFFLQPGTGEAFSELC
ncbi:hypothetical protein AB205_0064010 [Aquarana catesbeiana]|uniref:Uncharacterized protein n=1 Tax=Aquarana catesbeiana TaxID=8400 RepID=A0A2G9RTV5_AQUCT|nr:hypothetical protein AB205_0064010 [Aquarana catesbeiana]